jgi:hypothetical protein
MKPILSELAFVGVAGALLLAGCGGGGAGTSPVLDTPGPPSGVPSAATTSSAGALAFVKAVAASNDAEPIPLGDAVLATSDTDEPDPGI